MQIKINKKEQDYTLDNLEPGAVVKLFTGGCAYILTDNVEKQLGKEVGYKLLRLSDFGITWEHGYRQVEEYLGQMEVVP